MRTLNFPLTWPTHHAGIAALCYTGADAYGYPTLIFSEDSYALRVSNDYSSYTYWIATGY